LSIGGNRRHVSHTGSPHLIDESGASLSSHTRKRFHRANRSDSGSHRHQCGPRESMCATSSTKPLPQIHRQRASHRELRLRDVAILHETAQFPSGEHSSRVSSWKSVRLAFRSVNKLVCEAVASGPIGTLRAKSSFGVVRSFWCGQPIILSVSTVERGAYGLRKAKSLFTVKSGRHFRDMRTCPSRFSLHEAFHFHGCEQWCSN
jgi:hypothetical protein